MPNEELSQERKILNTQITAGNDVDIRKLLYALWKGKWIVFIFTMIFAVGSVFLALSKPNIYSSSILLAATSDKGNNMGALASQFGGLASLAGVSLGGGSSSKTELALSILKSRKFLTEFVNRHDLKASLFAVEKWSPLTGELHFNSERFDVENNNWKLNKKNGSSFEPSDWQVYKLISSLVSVKKDSATGMVVVSVHFISPQLAKQWASLLISDLNQEMRRADSEEVDRNIAFLKSKLELTRLADMRIIFYQLIEEQLKTKMLSQAQIEYVFKIVDPAVIAEERSKPNRALISLLGTMFGMFLGIVVVMVCYLIKQENE